MDEELLTAREVKDRLRCGLSTVYELFNAGQLRGFRLRGDWGGVRIYASSVAEMMRRNTNVPEPAPAEPTPVLKPPPPERRGKSRPGRLAGSALYIRPPD